MLTNVALAGGSFVPILIVVAVGIVLAGLAGLWVGRLERRHLAPARQTAVLRTPPTVAAGKAA